MNEDWRQSEIAGEVSTATRKLAHSTRTVPSPPDSYTLLGELEIATASLVQVAQQLARWHDNVEEGVDYSGQDERGAASGSATAGYELRQAEAALALAAEHIASAHSANAVVRWTPRQNTEH